MAASIFQVVYAAITLLGTQIIVQGGTLRAEFSENDFSGREGSDELVTRITVQGQQDNGDVVFGLEVLTVQQFRDSPSGTCQGGLSLPSQNMDPGELNDFSVTRLNCTRELANIGSTNERIDCILPISRDTVFEGDEYVVIVLSVVDNANNTVNIGTGRCTIGIILAPVNQGENRRLVLISEQSTIKEGDPSFFTSVIKTFESELLIQMSITISSFVPPGSNYQSASHINGRDYTFNGNLRMATILANETELRLPMVITDDSEVEQTEFFTATFTARLIHPDGELTEVKSIPESITFVIQDNDVVIAGFDVTEDTIEVLEGQRLTLHAVLKSHTYADINLSRDVVVKPITVDGTAVDGEHYRLESGPDGVDQMSLLFNEVVSLVLFMIENDIAERSRSFEVSLEDMLLSQLSDPAERHRHQELNILEPSRVTIVIKDNDGGSLQAKFSEKTFSGKEGSNELVVNINVQGQQDNGDVVFGLEVLTVQQFRDSPSGTCQGGFSLPSQNMDPGELNDFSVTRFSNCTRELANIGSTNEDIDCILPISRDAVFEGNEYVVIVLSVVDPAGNTVTIGTERCTIGIILPQVTTCTALMELANGVLSYNVPNEMSRYNIGTQVTYRCNEGFTLPANVSPIRTCDRISNSSAEWTGETEKWKCTATSVTIVSSVLGALLITTIAVLVLIVLVFYRRYKDFNVSDDGPVQYDYPNVLTPSLPMRNTPFGSNVAYNNVFELSENSAYETAYLRPVTPTSNTESGSYVDPGDVERHQTSNQADTVSVADDSHDHTLPSEYITVIP